MNAGQDRPSRRCRGEMDRIDGLRLACDRLGLGLWDCDLASGRLDANEPLRRLLGDPSGHSTRTLSGLTARVHPEDVRQFAALVDPDDAQGPTPAEAEFRLWHADSHWLWGRGRLLAIDRDRWGTPVRLLGAIEDISERKHCDRLLAEREALLAAIPDPADAGILLVDVETLGLVRFNRAMRRLLGYTEAEFSRLRLQDIQALPATGAERCFRERVDTLRQTGDLTLETPYRHRDGHLIHCRLNLRLLASGQREHVLAVCTDITGENRAGPSSRLRGERQSSAPQGSNDGLWDCNLDTNTAHYQVVEKLPSNSPNP